MKKSLAAGEVHRNVSVILRHYLSKILLILFSLPRLGLLSSLPHKVFSTKLGYTCDRELKCVKTGLAFKGHVTL
jgi:hypothetical protein